MKNKNGIKILLDIVMVILLVLMFKKNVISMSFHEIGGLVVCGLFVVHMLLNYKWIIGVTKKLFSKGLKFKTRLGYIINVLLLLIMAFIGVSGILISKTIFTNISSNNIFWKIGHQVVSGYGIILVGIHIGLHWDFLRSHFKKFIKISIKVEKPLGIICGVLIMVYGMYSIGNSNLIRWISMPFTISQIGDDFNKGTGGERPQGNREHLEKQGETRGSGELSDNQREGKGERGNRPLGKGQPQGFENGQGEDRGFREGKGQMTNGIDILRIISVIGTYLSITLSFSIITILLEKLVNRCYKKRKDSKVNEKVES